MPQVPVLDTFTAQPSDLPSVQAQAPESAARMGAAFAEGADQQKALGEAGTSVSDAALNIQTKMQEQANEVRVQDAINQSRQAALDLQYGKVDPTTGQVVQPGYSDIKGQAALQRDSGQPLSVEYGQKLQDQMGDIQNQLGNDAQKRLFALHAGQIATSFQEGVQAHTAQQFQEYSQSVSKGAIDLAQNSAALNWQNPDAINQAVDQAKTGVKTLMQGVADTGQGGQGRSANETTSAMQVTESAIRSKVIDSALENNNPTYALAYFNQYKGSMTADDILKVQGKINTQVDQHVALDAVTSTTKDNLHLLAPTTSDRAYNLATGGVAKAFQVAVNTESGTQQFNPDGSVVTSPKGATGIAQVMPTTGPEAAKLAGLPWDENKFKNDANYNYQLGAAYFNKQVTDFGGIDKGFAAYNAGPQALKDAMAQAQADGKPQQWLSYLPKETQDYVTKNTNALQTGGGVPVPPTKQQFVASALSPDVIGTDPRPQVVSLIRDQAEKQYDLMIASRKEQGENAMQDAQRTLDQNGGDMTQLSAVQMSNVTQFAPEKLVDLYRYAKGIASPPAATNVQAYAHAVANPDELAKMSDADFATWQKTNMAPGRDMDHMAMLRADVLSGKNNDSAQAINSKEMTSVLNNRLNSIGISPSPKAGSDDAAQVATIRKFVSDDIFQQQAQIGRKFTPKEISDRVDQLFSQSTTTNQFFNITHPNLALKASDIPDSDLTAVTAALAKRGVAKPTDDQLLRTYWNWKK